MGKQGGRVTNSKPKEISNQKKRLRTYTGEIQNQNRENITREQHTHEPDLLEGPTTNHYYTSCQCQLSSHEDQLNHHSLHLRSPPATTHQRRSKIPTTSEIPVTKPVLSRQLNQALGSAMTTSNPCRPQPPNAVCLVNTGQRKRRFLRHSVASMLRGAPCLSL